MSGEEKQAYPNIPAKHWWALRRRFQQSIPASVTPGYVAATLGMTEVSAKTNVIPSLVRMGLIDTEGKPVQQRIVAWRDDQQYPNVCTEILSEVYPRELIDALPGPTVDRVAVERWFSNRTGVGASAARRMAVVYEILTQADPSGGVASARKRTRQTRAETKTRQGKGFKGPIEQASEPRTQAIGKLRTEMDQTDSMLSSKLPSLHIDIQVHIPAAAGPEQIDAIFASMAKHLFPR